jgi:hypothetical protein
VTFISETRKKEVVWLVKRTWKLMHFRFVD